jgi:membrane fusion protein (multidrug efflux system)
VDNPDHVIWPGTYADVHFVAAANAKLLIVPEQALLFRAQGMQVAVVDQHDVVTLRDVKLGLNLGQTVQILSGLAAADRIINDPSAGLLDGEQVHVVAGAPGMAPDKQFRVQNTGKAGAG